MAYAAVLLLCVLDHLFSFRHLSAGGRELNPVMQLVMAQPFWISFTIKNTWTTCLLAALYMLGKKAPRMACTGLNTVLAVYGLLILYHLFGSIKP